MGALTALFNSEKAIAGGVLVIAATVLVALGQMSPEAWTSYTEVIFGAYIVGKTTQGVVTSLTTKPSQAPAPSTPTPTESV